MYFTVKHVSRGGDHQFWQTDCVHCAPRNCNPCVEYDRTVTFYTGPSHLRIEIDDGEVYVMNDQGQTVQRYRLEAAGTGSAAASPEDIEVERATAA